MRKMTLIALAMFISLNAQKFERPKSIDVSKYQSICSRVINSKANLGYFIDAFAEIPIRDDEKREKNGTIFFPAFASLEMFDSKRREIEREKELYKTKNRKYDKGAQYYINRYEELSSVFDINLIIKGMKNTENPKKAYCLYEITYAHKQKLDLKKFPYYTAHSPIGVKMPSIAELTDKDFNTLSNLAGYSLGKLEADDREMTSYLIKRYFLVQKDSDGYRYTSKPWGKDVKLYLYAEELDEVVNHPEKIDLPY
ncbi:hypothetical protein [Helicobacter pametensis]|uniref:hypothetical protein n=1 Tax=Helicobacter pametensis TaxID=95149 RepID=UPI0004899873|nr:hypothetical protein [Helicobacter pametensis]